jgi:hypothetical protein
VTTGAVTGATTGCDRADRPTTDAARTGATAIRAAGRARSSCLTRRACAEGRTVRASFAETGGSPAASREAEADGAAVGGVTFGTGAVAGTASGVEATDGVEAGSGAGTEGGAAPIGGVATTGAGGGVAGGVGAGTDAGAAVGTVRAGSSDAGSTYPWACAVSRTPRWT